MEDEEDTFLAEDKDRDQIRAELAEMSFEDLQNLKERIGTKIYNETMFGAQKRKPVHFKRENKNRPREMSAKRPVSRFKEVIPVRKHVPRDPRFDSLCGEFNEKTFKKSYKFLDELRANDLQALKKELKTTEDPKRVKKIKYLIQRLENQLREANRLEKQKQKQIQEKHEIIEAIKHGEKPVYKKKSEKKILDLVDQYEELKSSGKVKKHIDRLRKKNVQKNRRKLEIIHEADTNGE